MPEALWWDEHRTLYGLARTSNTAAVSRVAPPRA
jgi:hypothetical protein